MFKVLKKIYVVFLATGQAMPWYGVLGALLMGLMFIGVSISLIYTEGLKNSIAEAGIFVFSVVWLTGIMCLSFAWGRVRLLLGKSKIDSKVITLLDQSFIGGTFWLLNALGLLFALLLLMSPLVFIDWLISN